MERLSQSNIIARFISTHGTRYDYSRVKYTRIIDKAEITCRQHSVFSQTPGDEVAITIEPIGTLRNSFK